MRDDAMDIARGEMLDALEEEWNDRVNGELTLRQHKLNVAAIRFLMQKFITEQKLRQHSMQTVNEAPVLPTHRMAAIERVVLVSCAFRNNEAVLYFIRLLQMMEGDLRELFIVDTCAHRMGGTAFLTLLNGLLIVRNLERLAIDYADLCGWTIGSCFQHLLKNHPNLRELRLVGCEVDDGMLDLFLEGLQHHARGLRHLDLEGCEVDDSAFEHLVDTILASNTRNTLESLDISGACNITSHSLHTLADLLREVDSLEELVCTSCFKLFEGVHLDSPSFQDFVAQIQSHKGLKELRVDDSFTDESMVSVLVKASRDSSLQALGISPTKKSLESRAENSPWGSSSNIWISSSSPLNCLLAVTSSLSHF